jgi:hypothetical protein
MGSDILYGPVDPSDLALRPKYFSNPVISLLPPPTDKQLATNKNGPKSPTTFLATNRVFNTTELFEQIVENCLFTDLLTRLPRVSSTWKRVIDNTNISSTTCSSLPGTNTIILIDGDR